MHNSVRAFDEALNIAMRFRGLFLDRWSNAKFSGHASRAMLSRYSHVRMEAKRRALDEIAARQRAADEKRKENAQQPQGWSAAALPRVVP
jgi:hypothetical protein